MIYCSYSQKDRSVVQRVCKSLADNGVHLFVDYEQLAGGDYAQELTKQIESAEAILLFYSENTENSTWVKHEIEFALSKNKYIIPILLSEPEESSWLHFYLGAYNWIKLNGENVNNISDRIINVLSALYQRDDVPPRETNSVIEEDGSSDAPQSDKSNGFSFARNKKKYGCGLIAIIGIIVVLYFVLFNVSSPNPSYKPNASSYDNTDNGHLDSLVLKQREAELRSKVDEQLLRLRMELESLGMGRRGSGSSSQSIIHEIELTLGEDSIPFPKDSINTPYGFHKYQETVYSVLDRKIAEMELKLEKERSSNNVSFKGNREENKQKERYSEVYECRSDNDASVWLLMLFSFIVGSGLMFLLLRVKNSRKYNMKLSSDIASKISIDGDLQKEIESREVYTTHLEKGEYLIDFEDKNDENRHKTFNHEVTSKDSKLIFANFLEESSQNGKTIKCFIAGSKTLQQERDALRAVTCVMYNKWDSRNFRILSYTFEDFKREHTLVPPQEMYNKFIEEEADWALFIIDGEIGGITVNEYRVAMDSFKRNGRPKILALAKVGSENNEKVAEIRDEINKEHQYWTDYTDIVSLKYIFESTLNWDLIRMFQDK